MTKQTLDIAMNDIEIIGAGEECLVFRKADIVIKRLYTTKSLAEVKRIQTQARGLIAAPELKAFWPIDYLEFRGVVFIIQSFAPGVTPADIMMSPQPPTSGVAKLIYDDREHYWNDATINGSFLARMVSGGKTVDEAIAEGRIVYDYGLDNFRINGDEIVVVDVSFLGIPDVARELRRKTTLSRKERISELRRTFLDVSWQLIREMDSLRMFDKYED